MMEIYMDDYAFNEWEDDDKMRGIKEAISSLRPVERKIFLTYVEGGTYTSVANEFGVSVPTAKKYICEIIDKIKERL